MTDKITFTRDAENIITVEYEMNGGSFTHEATQFGSVGLLMNWLWQEGKPGFSFPEPLSQALPGDNIKALDREAG